MFGMLLAVLLAVSASAAVTEIDTVAELTALMGTTDSAKLSGDYKLTADIDLTGVANQKPIGSKDYPFTGTFDGDGHTVSGIAISTDTAVSTGLFGHVQGNVTIKNLTVSGTISSSAVNADMGTGMIGSAGGASGTITIKNCVNNCVITGSTTKTDSRVGGILGLFTRGGKTNVNLVIEDCVNTKKISGYKHVGGIVGRIHESTKASSSAGTGTATIKGCTNCGDVYAGTGDGAGGIVGPSLIRLSKLTIQNCYNNGSVSATERVGGIAAVTYIYSTTGSILIQDCVNMGDVELRKTTLKSGDGGAGGILGAAATSADSATGKTTIKNCFNGGDVTLTSAFKAKGGMIVGSVYAASAVDYSTGNCYYAEAKLTAGGNEFVTTKVTDLSDPDQYPASYADVFVFTGEGPISKNAPHDCLLSLDGTKCICAVCDKELLSVSDGVILIETAEDLLLLMANANNKNALGYSYKLTANIDLASADGQTPIGTVNTPFTGIFDGDGKKIEGIKIATQGVSAGLFGHASGATIKNLTVDGKVSATGMIVTDDERLGTGIGGIVGTVGAVANKTTTVTNCINNCEVTSTSNPSRIGGIVGVILRDGKANVNVVITDCVNYGYIHGKKHAGGIVGRQEDARSGASGTTAITGCINYGDIEIGTGNLDSAGGILGCSLAYGSETAVEKCYNFGDVSGGYRIGGITGVVYNYTSDSSATIDSCVNVGAVEAHYDTANHSVGGILGTGAHSAATAMGTVTVKNCFNAGSVTAIANRAANGGMIIGLVVAAGADAVTYLDSNNYYATSAALNEGGNTNGGEAILGARWCLDHGFTYTDDTETERTHMWDADDVCQVCGTEKCTGSDHVLAWYVDGANAVVRCIAGCDHTVDATDATGIYVSDNGDDNAGGLTKATALKSYALAQDIAASMGKDFTIYLVGKVTLANRKISEGMTLSKSFEESVHADTITVTSADANNKGTLVIPSTVTYYHLYGPTTFENIKITGTTAGTSSGGGTIRFYARGFDITFGMGIEMTDIAGKITYKASNGTFGLSNEVKISDAKVYVNGGFQNGGLYDGVTHATMNTDLTTNVTVLTGSYYAIIGGSYSSDTGAVAINFENANCNVTVGDISARYIAPFGINGTFTATDSVANMYVKGKVTAQYMYRVLFDSNGSGSGDTVNYFFYADCVGMQVGDYPMVKDTPDSTVNAYYEEGADTDPVAIAFHTKSVYYRHSYPSGEKNSIVAWCAANGGHTFVDGACSFCNVAKCTGSNHFIVWDESGVGKCVSGCAELPATVANIRDYNGIYVSDTGKDSADGKTASTPIRSYTLAQRLAAKAGKTFTIYLLGTVTLDVNAVSESNTYNRCFEEAIHTNSIKVTKGASAKATLVIPYRVRNYFLSGPVTFTNIKISGDDPEGAVRFFARGNNITMGSGLEMVNIAGGSALTVSKTNSGISGFGATVTIPNSKVYLFGGFLHSENVDGLQDGGEDPHSFSAYMSIQSGKYWAIVGGSYSDAATANPVTLDGANIRIGMSAFTARYLSPVNLNGKCEINNTTVKMEYKGTAKVAEAHRFIYASDATGGGNTIDHFFYKGVASSEFGDFVMGSANAPVAVNCYYATALSENKLILGFNQKSTMYAEAYGQMGNYMSFPEWCVEYGGGHNFVDGVCSFCEIKPCVTHNAEWEVLKAPTCNATGVEAKRCAACFEHVEEDRILPIDENAHDAAWIYGETEATYVCSICGETLETTVYADLAATGEIHVSAVGNASGIGTAEKPVNDFGLAMQIAAVAAADAPVTVYVRDVVTIYDNGASATLLDYVEPEHEYPITITSYGDTRATLRFDDISFRTMAYYLSGPTTFENIEFSSWSNDKAMYIVARHNPLVMGEGISIDYQRKGANSHGSAVYLVGGCYGTANSADCGNAGADLTIKSGSYSSIYGGTLNGNCCNTADTEPIYLNLLGDVLARNAIVAGSSGNSTYDAHTGDIYITVDGNITTGTFFSFSSAGSDATDAANPVPFTSQNVTLKIYGGTIITENFRRNGALMQPRVVGATAEGETAVDRLEKLDIYVDPTNHSAVALYKFLKTELITPVTDAVADEETGDEEEDTPDSGEDTDGDEEENFGAGSGVTKIADPSKYEFFWMDDMYCEVRGGDHTPAGEALETLDATCTMEGYELYLCSACNEEYSVTLEKTEHAFDVDNPITIAATCIAPEMEKVVCADCSQPKYTVTGSAYGEHTEPVGGFCQLCNKDLSADCAHENATTEAVTSGCGTGTKWYCPDCDKTVVDVISDGHNYGKYTVTVEPTETQPGIKTRTCKGCGKVDTALLYATDAVNASAVATDANGNIAMDVAASKLTKSEKAALNALLQQEAYGAEVKISYETDGDAITGITYSIPVPAEYTEYTDVRVVIKDEDGDIHFVDFKIEKGYIVFTF